VTTVPCAGLWRIFDSTKLADHQEAAALCATCPILEDCNASLTETLKRAYKKRHGPRGTWAGQLLGHAPEAAKCGTESGYNRHRKRGERPCDACRVERSRMALVRVQRRRQVSS
jgi:hypothetical protein